MTGEKAVHASGDQRSPSSLPAALWGREEGTAPRKGAWGREEGACVDERGGGVGVRRTAGRGRDILKSGGTERRPPPLPPGRRRRKGKRALPAMGRQKANKGDYGDRARPSFLIRAQSINHKEERRRRSSSTGCH
ncbi:hypothetical protein MRX96_040606 [Rhipicephalus microplus]